MKSVIYSLIIISFFNSLNAQKKELDDSNYNPPGTIFLKENLYIDPIPVTNLEYNFFLQSIKQFWSPKLNDSITNLPLYGISSDINSKMNLENASFYLKMSLDEKLKVADKLPLKEYFRYPFHSEYPVVYINKKQAEMYCLWRTNMVMISWAYKSRTLKERLNYPKRIRYRLPTQAELNYAINSFSTQEKLTKTNEKSILKYRPRQNKLKNFFNNNISEYVYDSKIPFGTNWRATSEFPAENDYTGFRCVCEVIEK